MLKTGKSFRISRAVWPSVGAISMICLTFSLTSGCSASDGGGSGADAHSDSFDRRALLANVATNVIVPTLADLETAATSMTSAVNSYCEAIGTSGEALAQGEAQSAWREVMTNVQAAEVLRLGPAAMNNNELRDNLYSWPLASSCAVDQDVKVRFDDPGSFDISGRLTNRRGMDALEYVLFSADLNHSCPNPVAPEGWNELSEQIRTQARCDFAIDLTADIAATADKLSVQWSASGGNYIDDFSRAGESASSFESSQVALNVLSDALFFIEFEVKDIKLGEPAGITPNSCNVVGQACLEERESLFANHSKENILANMRSFEKTFTGGDGIGFDDMLIELGAAELAQTMVVDTAAMVAALEAVPGTFETALVSDYDKVVTAFAATKKVTNNLKSQFLTVLGLDLPDNAAGDND